MWRTSAAYKVHTSDLRIVILSSEIFHTDKCANMRCLDGILTALKQLIVGGDPSQ